MKKTYFFVRKLRTLSSERYDVFSLEEPGKPVALAEIHFKGYDEAYLTLILFRDLGKESIDQMIKEIDDDIIDIADIEKGNLFVRTCHSKELAGFNVDKEWVRPSF